MTLKERIDLDIKVAMKAKDKVKLTVLRSLKSMILLAGTEKGVGDGINEIVEMKILAKATKQRKDSAVTFAESGRSDLAENEKAELKIIATYLPQQLSEEEITASIKAIIEKIGASSIKDMGKVMKIASKELAGKTDNKKISEIVRSTLA